MKISLYIIIFFFVASFVGCNSDSKTASGNNEEHDSTSVDSSASTDYILVSPGEIFEYIFFEELEPDPAFVNPSSNATKYLTTYKMSVNIGVYTTDFIYLNLCADKINSLDYYKTILTLAPKINIYSAIGENFPERLQKNLTNRDSIDEISRQVYYRILEDLQLEGRQKTYSLIAGGVIIESIYLAVMNVKNYDDFKPLARKIFEQREFLNNTYNFIASNKTDPEIVSMLSNLEKLKVCFDQILKAKKEVKVSKNKDHLAVEGGTEYIITSADFNKLKTTAIEVRSEIVSAK
jgi:hypothetical protein